MYIHTHTSFTTARAICAKQYHTVSCDAIQRSLRCELCATSNMCHVSLSIYIYIYTHTYIYIYIHTYIHIHIYIYTRKRRHCFYAATSTAPSTSIA